MRIVSLCYDQVRKYRSIEYLENEFFVKIKRNSVQDKHTI